MTLIFLAVLFITFHFQIHSFPFSHVVFKQSDSDPRHQFRNEKGKGATSTCSHAGYDFNA